MHVPLTRHHFEGGKGKINVSNPYVHRSSIKAQLHQKEERKGQEEEGKAMNGEYHHYLKRSKGIEWWEKTVLRVTYRTIPHVWHMLDLLQKELTGLSIWGHIATGMKI